VTAGGRAMTGKPDHDGNLAMKGTRRRAAALAAGMIAGMGALAVAGLALAGCSSGAPTVTGGRTVTAGGSCGVTRTAANVPVVIEVTKGSVNCGAALGVEQGYATKLRQGDVPGTGGGAPVTVNGWTCQGYPTPEVLRTGHASECHTANAEVVAVLAVPSSAT
jgi:hypothetical protein